MVAARTTVLLAAAGAALAAVGLLSTNTTGWRGVAAGLTFWAGLLCLLAATVLLLRDRRRILSGPLPRAGFLLVAVGVLALLSSFAVALTATGGCDDTGSCIPPLEDEFRVLLAVGAALLFAGAATLLAQGLALGRTPDA